MAIATQVLPTDASSSSTLPRVLVVDDHASARDMLAKLLRSEGFLVDVACDGAVALQSVRDCMPDVVITDLQMPVMGGLDLCERLRELDPHLPVVLMTAFGEMESIVLGMRAGAQDYLTKPLQLDAVIASLHRAILRRATHEARRTVVPRPTQPDGCALLAEQLRQVNEGLVQSSLDDHTLAEEQVRQHGQLEALLGNLAEGVVIADTQGHIRMINAAAREIMGAEGRPVGTTAEFYAFEARDSDGVPLSVSDRPLERALHGEFLEDVEMLRVRPDGTVRRVLTNATNVRDRAGNVELAILVFRDITDLRLLEQQRKEHVALISHDLRTPLASIQLLAGMIRRDSAKDAPAVDIAGRAERIEQNVARMSAMVEEILEVARFEAGTIELGADVCELETLIAGIVGRLDDLRAARVIIDAASVRPIVADRPRLDRAITNLVTNALKYSPATEHVRIEVSGDERALVVRVVDRGPGMTPEELAKLFHRYYRAPSGKHASGVGLGLYITRLIVEAHGGTVEAESVPGRGSAFTMRLPLA